MTKRRDLVRELLSAGWVMGHGGKHDYFRKGSGRVTVPRHGEISDALADRIRKQAGLVVRRSLDVKHRRGEARE